MINFKKEQDYLICIDSDGTIMDTMTSKHVNSFGPKFIEVFNINEHKEEILNHWLDVNLYKKTRGINRFEGLEEILSFSKTLNYDFPGFEEFSKWVKETKSLSNASLQEEIDKHKDNYCLNKAMEWSLRVNESIASLPPSVAFLGVKEILNYLDEYTDLVGVSSANRTAVTEEWTRLDLIKYFKFLGCQDSGTKAKIIKDALNNGYNKDKVLMIGDALGDYNAAKENGVKFFPITPKKEVESWEKLKNEGFNKFLNNEFDDKYQQLIMEEYLSSLN